MRALTFILLLPTVCIFNLSAKSADLGTIPLTYGSQTWKFGTNSPQATILGWKLIQIDDKRLALICRPNNGNRNCVYYEGGLFAPSGYKICHATLIRRSATIPTAATLDGTLKMNQSVFGWYADNGSNKADLFRANVVFDLVAIGDTASNCMHDGPVFFCGQGNPPAIRDCIAAPGQPGGVQ